MNKTMQYALIAAAMAVTTLLAPATGWTAEPEAGPGAATWTATEPTPTTLPTDTWFTTAKSAGERGNNLTLPSMASMLNQTDDPGYDAWRASMDAARAKRRRGMILTAAGFLGAPLVGGLVAGGSAAAGSEAGVGVGGLIYLAGIGVGVYGVFQWINGHSEMGDVELDGERAGYVSVAPVRGGAVATLALSF